MRALTKLAILAAMLAPAHATWAAVVIGSFSGTLLDGTDGAGLFGTAGADLTGDAVTGVYTYDTGLLSSVTDGTVTTGTGQPGALRVTVTIDGQSVAFNDGAGSSVAIDSGSGELDLQTTDLTGGNYAAFQLSAVPAANGIDGAGLEKAFTDPDLAFSLGSFTYANPDAASFGDFTLTALSQSVADTPVPEPTGLGVILPALAGLAVARAACRRPARSAA